ncbi:MAG: hypothetical protein ABI867_03235 [Kofleriaceae bacterium]
MRIPTVLVMIAACSGTEPEPITIVSPPELAPALREFAALTPYEGVRVGAATGDGFTIEVVVDQTCRECYRIDATSTRTFVVHTGDLLGSQYGVAHALENLGFRFRTPTDTFVPEHLAVDPAATFGVLQEPEIRGQRGLQLHTLHPIEAHFALWQPGDDLGARRMFDWIIKNRGNHVQWPALDDIMKPARHAEWQASTQVLLDAAHARGLTVGLGVQIFGGANMQQAFDLSDDAEAFDAELAARLPLVTDLPFDAYVLAFGEFSGEEPARFVAAVDATVAAIRAARPSAAVHASIHVGADQRVDYMGENLPYYFLIKYADPAIVPNVHTVMFYNLFEDAGGAYGHADFSEHREYLLDQMRRGLPASYYPESAYWVAFDNSVPLFLPVYVRSRWLDLDRLGAAARAENLAGLDGHLVFSSGWEWGYWLNDYASLRASYALPDSPRALIGDAYGTDLAPAADLVGELADRQAAGLIDQRLAPYLAGRDLLIDAGDMLGIHSQPDRVTFDDLVVGDAAMRTAFAQDVLDPLDAFAGDLEELAVRAHALDLADSRWSREVLDGFDVTAARARFVVSAYRTVLAQLAGDASGVAAARACGEAALADGTSAVARRHADPHFTGPREQLFGRPANATVYGFGYLFQADTLCYWQRERAQLAAIVDGATNPLPACTL